MQIPAERWYRALQVRRSRRRYDGRTIKVGELNQLVDFVEDLNNSIEGVRAVIVTENPDKVFKGIIGSYGKIKGAPAYAAFIGDISHSRVQENLGYLGQCLILEATALGLGTCWVGGFFNHDVVHKQVLLMPSEKVLAVTPLGYAEEVYNLEDKLMAGLPGSHKRKDLASLCKGLAEDKWPEWISTALKAARIAPSAVNRQPWRFTVEDNSILLSATSDRFSFGISKRLDCGIAMLHLQIGALQEGQNARFELLDSPYVARLLIK